MTVAGLFADANFLSARLPVSLARSSRSVTYYYIV